MKAKGIFRGANFVANVTDVARTGNVFGLNVILESLFHFIRVRTVKALPWSIRPLLHLLRDHDLQRTWNTVSLLYWSLKIASTFSVMASDISVIIMLLTFGFMCFLLSCIFNAALVEQTCGHWRQGNVKPVKCLDSTWALACCFFLNGASHSRQRHTDAPSKEDSLPIFSSNTSSTSEEYTQCLLSVYLWFLFICICNAFLEGVTLSQYEHL